MSFSSLLDKRSWRNISFHGEFISNYRWILLWDFVCCWPPGLLVSHNVCPENACFTITWKPKENKRVSHWSPGNFVFFLGGGGGGVYFTLQLRWSLLHFNHGDLCETIFCSCEANHVVDGKQIFSSVIFFGMVTTQYRKQYWNPRAWYSLKHSCIAHIIFLFSSLLETLRGRLLFFSIVTSHASISSNWSIEHHWTETRWAFLPL